MLMRFDPFREVDRLADEAWGQRRPRGRVVPIDVYKAGDRFVALLDLPGVDSASIELTVDKHVLTVSAERATLQPEGSESLISERPSGQFTKRFYLGEGLDLDSVEAGYDQGVLKITIPVAEKAKPRKVEVTVGTPAPGAIDATSTSTEANAA